MPYTNAIKTRLFRHRAWLFPLALFLLNLILIAPWLVPSYASINSHDEAKYIESGRKMLNGELREPSWGPLVAVVYAAPYPFVQHSPDWFVLNAAAGRFILFGLLWFSLYRLFQRFGGYFPAILAAGLFALSRAGINILENSSDALFAALSALALAEALAYAQGGTARRLWAASTCIGLAALARNDGILLFAVFLLYVLISILRTKGGWRRLLPVCLPFALIFGGYLLLYGAATGHFELGTQERTYQAFEQGQHVVRADGSWTLAVEDSRRLYGTPEENGWSVFSAILRNPAAYLDRLGRVISGLPRLAILAYGGRMGMALLPLAMLGMVGFWRRRAFAQLGLLLLWATPFLFYFLTFFREGYLLLALAAEGVAWLWTLVTGRWKLPAVARVAVVVLLVASAVLLRGGYTFENNPLIGQSGEEQALAFLISALPEDSLVASYLPKGAVAAKMNPVAIPAVTTRQELLAWLEENSVRALLVDKALTGSAPVFWALVESEIGGVFSVGFITDGGNVQVLLVEEY
jgi:MFS family permease